MVTLRNLSILFLLFLIPSSLFAAERASGNLFPEEMQVQVSPGSFPEQTRISIEQHTVDLSISQIQKSESAGRVSEKQSTPLMSYHSNPVATKAVDRNISLFSERIRERFSVWLVRSGKYLDMMKAILKEKNMPEDIAFLPFIESGFNPHAYSVARAAGPWQFIASTGRRYGLKIDWWRDERRDPVKSTHAAANYLKDLHDMFGSWSLAMAAYNAGEGKILRALNKSKSDDYWDLLRTRHIRNETKEYVPRFIAAKLIATNPDNYGFAEPAYLAPLSYDEVMVDKPVDLDVAAECAGTTTEVIRELNPELRRWSTPPDASGYLLRIPYGKKDSFTGKLASVPDHERFSIEVYTVKKGDTLKKVSGRTGVPVNVILELNDDKGLKSLKAGEIIYLPPKGKYASDQDDRAGVRKASAKTKKTQRQKPASKKIIVTSLQKKQSYVND
jgi:membrane-bound lytic murein transglycosylase D